MAFIALYHKIMYKIKATCIIEIVNRKKLKNHLLYEFEKLLLVFGNETLIQTQLYKILFKYLN